MDIGLQDALRFFNTNISAWYGWINNADGEVYSNLKLINDDATMPTEEQVNAKIAELQADYDQKQYQRNRAAAYPSWQDQLDKIYHQGIDAWKADIQVIKDQHPKP